MGDVPFVTGDQPAGRGPTVRRYEIDVVRTVAVVHVGDQGGVGRPDRARIVSGRGGQQGHDLTLEIPDLDLVVGGRRPPGQLEAIGGKIDVVECRFIEVQLAALAREVEPLHFVFGHGAFVGQVDQVATGAHGDLRGPGGFAGVDLIEDLGRCPFDGQGPEVEGYGEQLGLAPVNDVSRRRIHGFGSAGDEDGDVAGVDVEKPDQGVVEGFDVRGLDREQQMASAGKDVGPAMARFFAAVIQENGAEQF